jgi:hypothetical protein
MGSAIPFSQAVEWLPNQSSDRVITDGHWSLQSQHCELHSRLHEYTTLGVMSDSSLASNAACLLERSGLSYLNVQNASNTHIPFWQPGARPQHTQNFNTDDYLAAFYTREAAEIVYKFYEQDYKVFGLPRPAWIDSAHGKLFHGISQVQCNTTVGLASMHDSDGYSNDFADEIDYIPTLVQRAGFNLEQA